MEPLHSVWDRGIGGERESGTSPLRILWRDLEWCWQTT